MPRWSCRALLALVCVATSSSAQLPPEKAARTFTVSPGLEIKLWASEPLFVNPTCMDIDHLGRVWVCESVNYRNKLRGKKALTRPEGDRIVILEDTKGTGVADKAVTFYQHPDLLAPLGIAVAKDPVGPGYKVYVCQSPDILVFVDKDGDGKADGPPTKLLTGFRGFDHDHGVHGILIGPDRKLYFSVGDAGVAGLQSSDGKGRKWTSNSTDCRAGTVWRCEMDGTKLELLAHNFRNEYEPCVDSFGNVFVSDNDDDGNFQTRICHVMFGGNYGYHPRGRGESHWHEEQPGVVPKILRTGFGSPTGMCVYEGTLLPKKYWGQPLHVDAGPRHLRAYHLKPQGASFAAEREDIVQSSDNWFRPSDVCVAPDGSVFVADWYDPGVGGHGMGDIKMGRVYRIAPPGHKPVVPTVELGSTKGLLNALGSPNLAVRYVAMEKLRIMPYADAVKMLKAGTDQPDNVALKARRLWQLATLATQRKDAPTQAAVAMVCGTSEDPRFHELFIRINKEILHLGLEERLLKAADQYPPAERREWMLALRDVDPTTAKPYVLELAKLYDGKDRFYLAAIGIAVGHHDEKRREILLADFEKHFPNWDERVANLVWELRPPQMVSLLSKRLADTSLSGESRARIVDILATAPDADAGQVVLKLLTLDTPAVVRERIIENLRLFLPGKWQKLRTSPDLDSVLKSLLDKPQSRETAVALIAAASRADHAGKVLDLARNKDEPATVRRAAIDTLGRLQGDVSVQGLIDLVAIVPADLQADVVGSLGEHGRGTFKQPASKKAVQALQDLLPTAKTPALREAVVLALSAGQSGSQWLLQQHMKKALPADVLATASRVLRNSPFRKIQDEAVAVFPAPSKLDLKKLPAPAVLATRKGDADKGKLLLADSLKGNLQCLKCHTVRGVGGQIGPDLSMIGKKASRENLFESILAPSKAIADQYVTWVIETTKGLSLQGLIIEETSEIVIVRDAEGRDTRVSKKEIEKREKSLKSIMPEDLAGHVNEDELVDLVEYLVTLQTPALAVDSWHVVGPFDNGSGMAGLDRAFAPEKVIDLAATHDGKHGKVSWATVKPGANGYVDLSAYFAPRSSQIVSYVMQEIVSPVDQDATILLGTDGGVKVWVNDAVVLTSRQTRTAGPAQESVGVKLKKGTNKILLKLNNAEGTHGFYFTLLAEQEVKQMGKK